MGWVNYIVVDKWKMKFDISRYVQADDLDEIKKRLKKIDEIYEELPEDAFEENHKNISLERFIQYMDLAKTTRELKIWSDCYLLEFMFMLFLKDRHVDCRVISEFDLDKKDEPAKKYVSVDRWLG